MRSVGPVGFSHWLLSLASLTSNSAGQARRNIFLLLEKLEIGFRNVPVWEPNRTTSSTQVECSTHQPILTEDTSWSNIQYLKLFSWRVLDPGLILTDRIADVLLLALTGRAVNLSLRCFEEKMRLSHFGEPSSRGWESDGRFSLQIESNPRDAVLCELRLSERILYDDDNDKVWCVWIRYFSSAHDRIFSSQKLSVEESYKELLQLQKRLGTSLPIEKLFRTILQIFTVFEGQSFTSFQPSLERFCLKLKNVQK